MRDDRAARVLRCRGKSYLDLLAPARRRLRDGAGRGRRAGRRGEVAAVLQACAEAGVAVVPFGGGTSVVGGLEALRGRLDALVSLDLGRLDRCCVGRRRSRVAWLRAGHPAAGGRRGAARARA